MPCETSPGFWDAAAKILWQQKLGLHGPAYQFDVLGTGFLSYVPTHPCNRFRRNQAKQKSCGKELIRPTSYIPVTVTLSSRPTKTISSDSSRLTMP